MLKAGLAGDGDAASEDMQVACLEAWVRTTEQDLVLAQALLSHPLGPSHDLSASLRSVIARDKNGHAYLTRQVPLPFIFCYLHDIEPMARQINSHLQQCHLFM